MKRDDKAVAVILAAGYATRLYPLTLNIPKPLLKITRTKAVIDFIVDTLEESGSVSEAIVVTNSKFFGDFLGWAKKRPRGRMRLCVVDDGTKTNEDRLGAVGDIYFAFRKNKIDRDLVVIGGDNLFDKGFGGFLKFARSKRPFSSLGVFDIGSKKDATRFGVVSADKSSKVFGFEEKPARPRSTLVATCLYYFPQEKLKCLERYVGDPNQSKDAPGNYIRWLMKEDRVYGFTMKKGHWHDIGHFDSYKEVVNQFK